MPLRRNVRGADHRKRPFSSSASIVACRFVAAGTYLPSRCLETSAIYSPISQSSRSRHYALQYIASYEQKRV
jgi:hypothetical protein